MKRLFIFLLISILLPLPCVASSLVDIVNSSNIPIASGGVFVGSTTDLLNWNQITLTVYSDVGSAVDGLEIHFSSDGKTWIGSGDCFTILAGKEKTFTFQPQRRYYMVFYQNGGAPQTVFDLQAILTETRTKPSSHRTSDSIVGEDDAELTKAVLTGEDETGKFVNIRSIQGDTGFNLKVSLDQVESTTNSVQTIDYSHAELHEGKHYQVSDTAILAKNGTRDILLIASDSLRWPHTTFAVGTNDAAVIVSLFEAVTYSASGTAAVGLNRNRNSAYTPSLRVFYSPTVTATGTATLFRKALGSGKDEKGEARDASEIILKRNTAYVLRIVEGNIAATNINWVIDWYEHANK